MDTTTALQITTQSIHDLTIAIERIASTLPENERKSVMETAKRVCAQRATLLTMLDQDKYSRAAI